MITIEVAERDVVPPSKKFDDDGKEVGWLPGEHEALIETAKNKIMLRAVARTDGGNPQHFALQTDWIAKGENIETRLMGLLQNMGKVIAGRREGLR